MASQAVGIGPATGTVEHRPLDLLEDRVDPGLVLLDLVQHLVDHTNEFCIFRLHLPHSTQALAKRSQRGGPALAQRRHLDTVVEVDDDVFLDAAQVTQRGAQIGHIGEGLHAVREQLLHGIAGAVQRHVAHAPEHHQQNQRKNRAEVQTCANR